MGIGGPQFFPRHHLLDGSLTLIYGDEREETFNAGHAVLIVRRRGHQLGLLVLGTGALRPAFLNRPLRGQNAIHRAFTAQVGLSVEQRGHHLGG